MNDPDQKQEVRAFWNEASCGEVLYLSGTDREGFSSQLQRRYELEPYILDFACFDSFKGKKVLEIGVGLGADHQKFSEAGADLYGIDLTERSVAHTRNRLACFGLKSTLEMGDAEHLAFADESFDLVYSWGVLHHSPDTPKAIAEVWRVLKQGGVSKVMIYHKWSMVGLLLWIRYALLTLRPFTSLKEIYACHLESPGTKAYSIDEAKALFEAFSEVSIHTVLTHGDLLESGAGQRHQGAMLSIGRKVWPRKLIRKLFPGAGLFMLIEARK
ncbi:MAG: methyltransferase domain-containing protein [Thiobacillus sp.]|jgi:SAM-dependent methyltransferase|nr:methyltransferase domain-containing protein [Thiobacillus sp.]